MHKRWIYDTCAVLSHLPVLFCVWNFSLISEKQEWNMLATSYGLLTVWLSCFKSNFFLNSKESQYQFSQCVTHPLFWALDIYIFIILILLRSFRTSYASFVCCIPLTFSFRHSLFHNFSIAVILSLFLYIKWFNWFYNIKITKKCFINEVNLFLTSTPFKTFLQDSLVIHNSLVQYFSHLKLCCF